MKQDFRKRTPPEFLQKFLHYSEIDWGVLRPADEALLQRSKSSIDLRRNEILFEAENAPKGLYILSKGKIKLFIRMPDGAEQIVFLYTPDEAFGFRPLIAGEKHSATATALEASQLEFIPGEVFLKILRQS